MGGAVEATVAVATVVDGGGMVLVLVLVGVVMVTLVTPAHNSGHVVLTKSPMITFVQKFWV